MSAYLSLQRRLFMGTLLVTLVAGVSFGQSTRPAWVATGYTGDSLYLLNSSGSLTIEDASATVTSIVAGDVVSISDNDVLIVGHDGVTSRIEHWRLDPTNNSLSMIDFGGSSTGGVDLTAGAYDVGSGKLFVMSLDPNAVPTIRMAYWQLGQPLASLAWVTIATRQDWPYLRNGLHLEIEPHPDIAGQRAVAAIFPAGIVFGAFFLGEPGAIQVKQFPYMATVPAIHMEFEYRGVVEGATSVVVYGTPERSFEIVDGTAGTVIGSGVISSTDVPFECILTAPFEIGTDYHLRDVTTGIIHDTVTAVRVYGTPGSTASGRFEFSQLADPHNVVRAATVRLIVGFDDHQPTGAARMVSAQGVMGLGLRENSLDPVIQNAGIPVLDPALVGIISIQGVISPGGRGTLSTSIVIPDDPSVVGLVALFQFAFSEGTEVMVTEILGVEIQP